MEFKYQEDKTLFQSAEMLKAKMIKFIMGLSRQDYYNYKTFEDEPDKWPWMIVCDFCENIFFDVDPDEFIKQWPGIMEELKNAVKNYDND